MPRFPSAQGRLNHEPGFHLSCDENLSEGWGPPLMGHQSQYERYPDSRFGRHPSRRWLYREQTAGRHAHLAQQRSHSPSEVELPRCRTATASSDRHFAHIPKPGDTCAWRKQRPRPRTPGAWLRPTPLGTSAMFRGGSSRCLRPDDGVSSDRCRVVARRCLCRSLLIGRVDQGRC